ncbi:MAG: hypothetical protein PF495_13745, partial [Spirochaetales bacterium]|nr:hypothetical protein [Spirochaetales bacterium]
SPFIFQLRREGVTGIQRRLQVVLHLMSNTQHLGLVVKSEYLHLSRSISAIVGTYLNLYKGIPRIFLCVDSIRTFTQLPVSLVLDKIADKQSAQYIQLLHRLPLLAGFRNPSPIYLDTSTRCLPEPMKMVG